MKAVTVKRLARLATYDGAVTHLVIAYHGDGTVTTLCSEEHVQYTEPEAGLALCKHCANVLKELNAAVN